MSTISELIQLINLRKIADEPPYKLVLGSDILKLSFNSNFSLENLNSSFSVLSRDEKFALLSTYTAKNQGEKYLQLANLIIHGYFDILVTTDPTNELETALLRAGLELGHFDVLTLGYDTKIESRITSRTPKSKIIKLRGDLLHRTLDNFLPSEALQVNESYEGQISSLIQTDSILLGVTNSDFDIFRYIRNNDGAIWLIRDTVPEPGSMLDALTKSRHFTNVVIEPNLLLENFFGRLAEALKILPYKKDEQSYAREIRFGENVAHERATDNIPTSLSIQTISPEVFISYAWGDESEQIVNEIDQAFQKRGARVIRDKRDLNYKGSIKEFMERIGQGQAVIVVISDKYLKSKNCMFELIQIGENKQFKDRVFPVVLSDADIYDAVKLIEYIKYWETKKKELNKAMKSVSSEHLQGIREEIDLFDNIRDQIAGLTNILQDMNTLTPDMHRDSDFQTLFDAVMAKLEE